LRERISLLLLSKAAKFFLPLGVKVFQNHAIGGLASQNQVEERIKARFGERVKIKNGSKLGLMLGNCKEHVR
jgi:hypothetical protein